MRDLRYKAAQVPMRILSAIGSAVGQPMRKTTRSLYWVLTPFVWMGMASLIGESEFIRALTGLEIGALGIALGGAVGGGIAAAQAPSGIRTRDVLRAQNLAPGGSGALGEQARIQALIQFGAPAQTIVEDFIVNRFESAEVPVAGKFALSKIANIQNALAEGNTTQAEALIRNFNAFTEVGVRGFIGVPVLASIEDGKLKLSLTGPEGEQINQLIGQTQEIFANRVATLQNISRAGAEFPQGQDLAAQEEAQIELQLANLERNVGRQRNQLIEQGNRLGISPAGSIGLLEQQNLLSQQQIETEGGLTRALQLLGGQQSLALTGIQGGQAALDPTLFGSAFNAAGLSQSAQQTGFQGGINVATASAQAAAARAAGISNAFGSLGGIGILGAGLLGDQNPQLSSTNLQTGLGVQTPLLSGQDPFEFALRQAGRI